jgi:hypothetical protein
VLSQADLQICAPMLRFVRLCERVLHECNTNQRLLPACEVVAPFSQSPRRLSSPGLAFSPFWALCGCVRGSHHRDWLTVTDVRRDIRQSVVLLTLLLLLRGRAL